MILAYNLLTKSNDSLINQYIFKLGSSSFKFKSGNEEDWLTSNPPLLLCSNAHTVYTLMCE